MQNGPNSSISPKDSQELAERAKTEDLTTAILKNDLDLVIYLLQNPNLIRSLLEPFLLAADHLQKSILFYLFENRNLTDPRSPFFTVRLSGGFLFF